MGKYMRDIAECTAAERRNRAGNTLASALAGEIEPARLIFSPADFWEEVRRWWPVQLLRRAARENDVEGYKRLLHYLLSCLNDEPPPKGVLKPWRGEPGRLQEKESDKVVSTWIEIGKPPLRGQKLAKAVYGEMFIKATIAQKKAMVDRCLKTIERRMPEAKSLRPHQTKSLRQARRNT